MTWLLYSGLAMARFLYSGSGNDSVFVGGVCNDLKLYGGSKMT